MFILLFTKYSYYFLFPIPHINSIGLISGEYLGHFKISRPLSSKKEIVDLETCGRALAY